MMNMKNLTIIVHANVQQDLADTLRSTPQVRGFSFTHVEGHSLQTPNDQFLSARDKVVGYVPRVRVDVLLDQQDVPAVLANVRAVPNGAAANGVYWVTSVHDAGAL